MYESLRAAPPGVEHHLTARWPDEIPLYPERDEFMVAACRTGFGMSSSQDWRQDNASNAGAITVDVDTSSAKFDTTPVYVVSLHGKGYHKYTTGGNEPYNASKTGFHIEVRYDSGVSGIPALTPETAAQYDWKIAWIGIEELCEERASGILVDPGIPTGFTKVIAKHSDRALNVSGGSKDNGASIIQYGPTANVDNELFQFISLGDGYYRIVGKQSDKVIDVTAGADTMKNDAVVRQWDWTNSDNQKFRVEPVGGGYYRIIAKHSLKALTVKNASKDAGAGIIQYEWVGGDNQRWKFS